MTNWIAKELLEQVNHTVKGSSLLEVITMTGKVQKRFQLVEVYFTHNSIQENLVCYVHDDFTKHITVKGLPDYLKNKSSLKNEDIEQIIDPATTDVDHRDKSLGIGLILCTAST
ncbi:unnamed protein product, partial [Meganyctiphanes norvegica]